MSPMGGGEDGGEDRLDSLLSTTMPSLAIPPTEDELDIGDIGGVAAEGEGG